MCMVGLQRNSYCGCEGDHVSDCPYGLTSDSRCRNSAVIKCCLQRCYAGIDLVVIMDSSGSMGITNYLRQKEFVKSLITRLNVSPNGTRVALIDYNSTPRILQNLNEFINLNSTIHLIDSMRYASISGN